MKHTKLWLYTAIVICTLTMVACFSDTKKSAAVSTTDDASQFVTITDMVPDAILEIRYFGTYNFVGTRIDGYEEPTALLTKKAADSLKAVSDDVKAQGYRLKIYDAYRPQKGVDHFVRWAEDINDTLMKPYFYPDLDKSVLFPQDYICLKSGHTRGSTLDLTLFDMATEKEVTWAAPSTGSVPRAIPTSAVILKRANTQETTAKVLLTRNVASPPSSSRTA